MKKRDLLYRKLLLESSQISRPIIIPSAFDWFTNTITYRGGMTYETDYDFDALPDSITGSVAYVDPDFGGVSNGSFSNPYKDLTTAFAASSFNEYRIKAGSRILIYASGPQIPNTRNIKIRTYNPSDGSVSDQAAEVSSYIPISGWTQNGTYSQVYQASNPNPGTSNIIGSVCDESDIDQNGVAVGLYKKTSLADCAGQAGSFYYDTAADVVYIHTIDAREPDSDIRCFLAQSGLILLRTNNGTGLKVYVENIHFYGTYPFRFGGTTTATLRVNFGIKNCRFSYGAYEDNFSMRVQCRGYLKDCRADYGCGDGFNYNDNNDEAQIFEWNCKSYGCDREGGIIANNGSTAHDAVQVIRVMGDYQYQAGKGVQDIENAKSLSICCVSKNSTASASEHRAGFASNSLTPSGNTEMWLFMCQGPDDANKFWNFNNSTMYIYDGSAGNLLQGPNQQDSGSVLVEMEESDVFL